MDTASVKDFPVGAGVSPAGGGVPGLATSSRVRHAAFWDEGQPIVLIADPDPCAYAELDRVCHRLGVQLMAFPDGAQACPCSPSGLPGSLAASGVNPSLNDWGLPVLAFLFPLIIFVISLLIFYWVVRKGVTAGIRDYVRKHGDRSGSWRP